jgi:hypothetical protein
MTRFFYTFLILLSLGSLNAQNGLIGAGFGTNNWTTVDNFGTSAGSSMIFTTRANGTGNQYFRTVSFGFQQSPSVFCTPGQDQAISIGNPFTAANTNCTNGAWFLNVPNTTDEYIFKSPSAGSNQFVLFRIQGAIRTISLVNQSPSLVFPTQAVTVTAAVSGPLSTGQAVYLRYTTDNWASSTVQSMTLSGPNYVSTIPSAINQAGATIRYYVFTSGAGLSINHNNADWYTINLNNNGGPNYSYTVQTEWTTRSGGDGTWDDPNMWDAFQVPPAAVAVRIQDNLTLDVNTTVSSFRIDAGATFTGSDAVARTLFINNNGLFQNNGNFNSAQGIVHFLGLGNISGNVNFNNINTQGGINFGTNSIVSGKFTILSGGYMVTNPCTYAPGSTLEFRTGGSYNLNFGSLSWDQSNIPYNLSICGGTTIRLYDDFNRVINGNVTIDSFSKIVWEPGGFDNGLFTINGNTSLSRDAEFSILNGDGNNAFTNNIRLEGNLTIDNSSRFAMNADVGDDITIAGNINNQNLFFSNNRLVVLDGNSPQNLTGNFIGLSRFHYLETNNAAGIFLNNQIYVEDELRMTSGLINIQASNLVLGPIATILGSFSTSNMIVPTSTGAVVKEYNSTGSFFFPVGDNNNGAEYSQISLNLRVATFGAAPRIAVNLKDEKHPNNPAALNFLSRHWTVEPSDISNVEYDIAFSYNDNDINGTETLIEEIKTNDNGINWVSLGIVDDGANRITLLNQTSFSTFTGGEVNLLSTELLRFRADLQNNEVLCLWTTLQEKNCDFFELEHLNKNSVWEKIAQVEAIGEVSSLSDYSVFHPFPHQGINYYRLKIVDLDGSFFYSNVAAVTLKESNGISYWWESTNSIGVRIESLNNELLDLSLYDASAKLIWNRNSVQLQNGAAIIDFSGFEIPKFSILQLNIGNKLGKTIQLIKP